MAQANVARRQGDDFQGRIFWLNAASLLDPGSSIVRVAYERGPKAFDDIYIEHESSRAPRDHEGVQFRIQHVQCKWHTRAGTFGYRDLVDPKFINASRHSLLQRVHGAQLSRAATGDGIRFELKTNWRIGREDPLLELIGKSSDAIDLDRLFTGETTRSRMGKVRDLWRRHLGIDEMALRRTIRGFAIAETTESLASLRQRLDERFAFVGLKRVSVSSTAFVYDDLIVKLLAQGRVEFDRESFREMARDEKILTKPPRGRAIPVIGVRSFMHPIDNMENRCDRMLDLVPHFEGRYIRNDVAWQGQIAPELRSFLLDSAKSEDRMRLVLDTHVSLAFAAGAILNVKSGKKIEIEQRTGGRSFWSMHNERQDPKWPKLHFDDEVVNDGGRDLAIAVSLTHDVSPAVREFVGGRLSLVERIVHCKPDDGVSQQSVRCGRHAWQYAESIVAHVLAVRAKGSKDSTVHLFIAGPNGFAFFLGQQRAIGSACVYEWDFEGQRGGGYSLGLTVTT